MHGILHNLQLALLLSQSFAKDGYFLCFFRPDWLGSIARFLFFVCEIRLRHSRGIVLESGSAVALVGLPPQPYLQWGDLPLITQAVIRLQGASYALRWESTTKQDEVEELSIAYLSALACAPSMRGQGEGTMLLKAVLAFAADQSLDVVCEVSSQKLIQWYEKFGFRVVGRQLLPDGSSVFKLRSRYQL